MRTSSTAERAMSPSPRQRRPAGEPGRAQPIAVSMGDPRGIGPDIALMSWRERRRQALPSFVLYGDPDVLAWRARSLGLDVPTQPVASLADAPGAFARALPVWPVPIRAAGTAGEAHHSGSPLCRRHAKASGRDLAR